MRKQPSPFILTGIGELEQLENNPKVEGIIVKLKDGRFCYKGDSTKLAKEVLRRNNIWNQSLRVFNLKPNDDIFL